MRSLLYLETYAHGVKKKFTDEELKGFDLTNILGCTCEIEVELTSGGNPKVTAVYHPEGGVQKIATVNEQLAFRC